MGNTEFRSTDRERMGDFSPRARAQERFDCSLAAESKFLRLGDVLLEVAITVAEVQVRYARNHAELDEALEWLAALRAQREVEERQRIDRDNEIMDYLHERMDAQRYHGGQSIGQFLASGAR